MGARSRRKGAQAERDLAKRFAEAMPGATCQRGIGQARRGSEVADCEVPHFWVESKHGKRPNPRAALAQSIEACEANGNGKTPIAVIRDDRKEPFVVIGLDDFLGLVGEWWAAKRHVEREPIYIGPFIAGFANGDAEAKCAAVGDEREKGI